MFRDCLRCGHGWLNGPSSCPICTDVPDYVAEYIRDMRNHVITLRRIGRKAFNAPQYSGLTNAEGNQIGLYL